MENLENPILASRVTGTSAHRSSGSKEVGPGSRGAAKPLWKCRVPSAPRGDGASGGRGGTNSLSAAGLAAGAAV